MVTLVAMLARRPDLSYEEFLDHWQHHHGPLMHDTPTIARHLLAYEQYPRHSPGPWSGSPDVDGVAVQRFADFEAWQAFLAEPAYTEVIAPDEAAFLDRSAVRFVVCGEPLVVIPPATSGDEAPR